MGERYRAAAIHSRKHDSVLMSLHQARCVNDQDVMPLVTVSARVHESIEAFLSKPEKHSRIQLAVPICRFQISYKRFAHRPIGHRFLISNRCSPMLWMHNSDALRPVARFDLEAFIAARFK